MGILRLQRLGFAFPLRLAFLQKTHALFAHSSPTYFRCGPPPAQRREAAQFFLRGIDDSLQWIDTYGRYNDDRQREEVKELFRRGREAYAELM